MDPGILVPLGAFIMITTIVTTAIKSRERMRMMDREALMPSHGDTSQRLDRIEQAIEAMAVEVERISEGQRFVTKLLSERAKEPASLGAGAASGVAAGEPRRP
ncbi:MAG: hypothetical protein IT359_17755 [Gemmatimonadaceae bacterium]|nr:hypothetical protein [Gemmatimonadaceae bacterium]